MNPYDPQKTAEVWQRVRPQDPMVTGDLTRLLAQVRQQSAGYQTLSRQHGDPLLKTLASEKQAQAAALSGIRTLLGDRRPLNDLPLPKKEPLPTALRRCFGVEQDLRQQYELRSTDRQFGPIFSLLAQEQQRHCKWLLEILGRV